MQASSAISFRLLPGSISAAASSGSPLPSSFLSGFSGLNFFPLSRPSVDFLTPAVFAFFRPLQFWVLTTQPLFFLSFLPVSASQWLPRCSLPLSLPGFPSSVPAWFPMLPFRLLYSASLFVSFRPSLLRSHSRSTGACLPLSPQAFSTSVPLPFVRFPSVSGYSAFCSSFPVSSPLRLTVAFQVRPSFFRRSGFPLLFHPVSRASLPLPGT